ncbi:hypothetical protein BDU57DRAFT_234434 [Ampelomyces quisqualis]|uniref:Uncharacterized protein n=1 Tax=Ampelomyces quisqualis TaxID=50730 RepID=A0A6A5QMG3_AMPQU|nr:hypothetical protein BDU57DRAFT_234434 [Ampelomyces quisqualis]
MMSMGYANRRYDHTNNVHSYEDAYTSGTLGLTRTYVPETQSPSGNQTHAFLRQPSSSGMARSFASALNGSKMIPSMRSAVISGQLPEMKVGDKLVFGNVRAAHEYLRQPKLTPTMGNTGCPVTSGDAMYCVRKIYNALISVDAVWDKEIHSEDFIRFLDGGSWSDPKDLQAVTFHISGTLGGMHKGQQQGPPLQFPDLREPMPQDVAFTFHQRLHWTCFLLKHYKAHANRFMCLVAVEAHVARIWSVLSRERSFRGWWLALTNEEKAKHLYEDPYAGMTYRDYPIAHPLSDNTRSLVAAGLGQLIGLESHPSPLASSTMKHTLLDSSGLASKRVPPNELNTKVNSAYEGSSANVHSQDDTQGDNLSEASYQELLDQISAEASFLSQDLGFALDEGELEKILDDPNSEIWKGRGAGFGETAKKGP